MTADKDMHIKALEDKLALAERIISDLAVAADEDCPHLRRSSEFYAALDEAYIFIRGYINE